MATNRVFGATQGRRLVYHELHLSEAFALESFLTGKFVRGGFWRANCRRFVNGNETIKQIQMGI